jgi:hypothetical protein
VLKATGFALGCRNSQETVLGEVVPSFEERPGAMRYEDPVSVNLVRPSLPALSNQ